MDQLRCQRQEDILEYPGSGVVRQHVENESPGRPHIEVHVLDGGVVPQEGRGKQTPVGSIGEEQLDEGSEYRDDVAEHDEHQAKPEDEEEVLVDDVGGQDTHSLFLLDTCANDPVSFLHLAVHSVESKALHLFRTYWESFIFLKS